MLFCFICGTTREFLLATWEVYTWRGTQVALSCTRLWSVKSFNLFGDWLSTRGSMLCLNAWWCSSSESCWSSEYFYLQFIAHCSFTQFCMKHKSIDDAWSIYRATTQREKWKSLYITWWNRRWYGQTRVLSSCQKTEWRNCWVCRIRNLFEWYLNEIRELAALDPGNEYILLR